MARTEIAQIFIGYDPREAVAFHVLTNSILRHASIPFSVTPLALSNLVKWHRRPRDPMQSTDFSCTRFLTPALCNFQGSALYMDCDMLVQRDIAELWALRNERYAVQVVQHHYTPRTRTKFLSQQQTVYAKKNWSSLMLFNSARCRKLTPEYVNTSTALELHRFQWLEGDHEVGALPAEWNYLVAEQAGPLNTKPANAHFTIGGPYFREYADTELAEEWRNEASQALVGLEDPMLTHVVQTIPTRFSLAGLEKPSK